MSTTRPVNIGIKAVEIYFPNQCVSQSELEKFDGVSDGKYTIGLGQTKMSFCDDREDIYSLALTVCSSLLRKYDIDVKSIGRLEVGTETLLDKSKSVKSVLMQLFANNTNIEGVDSINACYGGTNAVFNAVNWIESSAWDGRDAIVVAGDIALYAEGNARPTGGAGAIALLIGPNASIVFDPGRRGSYMQHVYDFYKPDLSSEYPIVDGHFSVKCYTKAVDACYKAYNDRENYLKSISNGHTYADVDNATCKTPLDRFDYMIFHAPTCKLVAKSYARLLYNDYLNNPDAEIFADVPAELRDIEYTASLTNKTLETVFMTLARDRFNERVLPSIEVPAFCGNMYTASVYSGLVSLLSNVDSDTLQGKRIGIFSYGSGLASSLFSCRIHGSTEEIRKAINLKARLAARRTVPPVMYNEMCDLRKKAHLQKNYTPSGRIDTIADNVYYLSSVDEMFRRIYKIKEKKKKVSTEN